MDQHKDNPLANQLPKGVAEDKLLDAVRASGYPLQSLVARELSAAQFTVAEEWGYKDKTENAHRSLDMYCFRPLEAAGPITPRLHLLVECKRSDLPFVFFVPGVNKLPKDFPEMLGCGNLRLGVPQGTRDASAAEFFCASEFPFVSPGPTIASVLSRAERRSNAGFELSGSVPFKQVMLPLASAMEQVTDMFGRAASISPMVVLALCVVDAPMVVASGTPEEPHLMADPWVRVVHQEASKAVQHWQWRYYTVDFIHRAFLGSYIQDHALPFPKALAKRVVQHRPMAPANAPTVRRVGVSWSEFVGG